MSGIFFLSFFVILSGVYGQFEDDQFDLRDAWFTPEMYNDPYFSTLKITDYAAIFPGN